MLKVGRSLSLSYSTPPSRHRQPECGEAEEGGVGAGLGDGGHGHGAEACPVGQLQALANGALKPGDGVCWKTAVRLKYSVTRDCLGGEAGGGKLDIDPAAATSIGPRSGRSPSTNFKADPSTDSPLVLRFARSL